MLDENTPADTTATAGSDTPEAAAGAAPAKKAAARKTAAKAPAKKAAAKKAPAKRAAKKTAAPEVPDAAVDALSLATDAPVPSAVPDEVPGDQATPVKKTPARRTRKVAAKQVAPPGEGVSAEATPVAEAPAAEAPAAEAAPADETAGETAAPAKKTAKRAPAKKSAAKKATTRTPAKKTAAKKAAASEADVEVAVPAEAAEVLETLGTDADSGTIPLFQAPETVAKAPARRTRKRAAAAPVIEPEVEKTEEELAEEAAAAEAAVAKIAEVAGADDTEAAEAADAEIAATTTDAEGAADSDDDSEDDSDDGTPTRRRRRRGGRRRRKSSDSSDSNDSNDSDDDAESGDDTAQAEQAAGDDAERSDDSSDNGDNESGSSSSRRRRRRRRSGDNDSEPADDPENTVVRVRKTRSAEDQITAVAGSTRLEAKKQRRREGREAGRRRAPIVSEAEFLARREAVERVMVVRQRNDLTQIAVLEDKVLVEHYVARESQTSLIGNVYLGRVQNVLPSMEAAFIDIGKGRNAVLYAGEVNWSALGHKDGQNRKIESVLSPGQPVLVQVTKDPIGAKGARLTSQVSLAGRFLVYVPDGTTSGISRKLPDTERSRLKALLKEIVPDGAGVIVRTAAEGASEEELTSDVERLKARWEGIEAKARGNAPQLLHGEPDLTLKVVRDLFTEDFSKLVIQGDEAWQMVSDYVENVAPDLADRLEKYAPADAASAQQGDIFSVYRIDEQIAKGLDRKVWLPSGGSLVIDRTEAMTVVDVNTGKFTGSGGNLEETVTKNNLEAAEEIVRQLRLRDIGGIIVVDFIDMVLEANRDLVVRRLVECLGRDRTRHQVAEVTSLGLVQMTRKRIGTGLLESFSHDCDHCQGRGVVTQSQPIEQKSGSGDDDRRGGRRGRGRGNDNESKSDNSSGNGRDRGRDGGRDGGRGRNGDKSPDEQSGAQHAAPSPKVVAAMARPEAAEAPSEAAPTESTPSEVTSTETPAPQASESAVDAPAIQVTSGRRSSRSRGRRGAGEQSTDQRAADSAPAPVETPVETPAEAAPQQPVVAAPATEPQTAPEATPAPDTSPRVITRERRGASRRTTTSGTPVAVTVEPTVVAEPAEVTRNAAEIAAVAPSDAPVESKPKVVTRTRGRAASRPAGPPTGEASVEGDDDGSESSVEHVPVKKKGARKR